MAARDVTTTAVPQQWPGAFSVYEHSKEAIKFNLNTLLVLFIISLFVGLVPGFVGSKPDLFSTNLVTNFIGFFVQLATTVAVIKSVKREKISLGDSISQSLNYAVKFFLLIIAMALIAAGSLLLLVIPFFFVAPRIALAPYFLIDQNLGVGEALSKSWEQTKGHSAKVWGIIGATLLMSLACIVLIGFYFIFMYGAAFAVLYFFIKNQNQQATK